MIIVFFNIFELRCIVRVQILNKHHQLPSGEKEVAQKGVKTLSSRVILHRGVQHNRG